MIIITLMALAGAGFYFMTPAERTRVLQWGVAHLRRLAGAAVRVRAQHRAEVEAEGTPHPWPVVTVSLAAATFAVCAWMALAPGDLADPETLVAWGANFGPRTTNGEWWRLATASFLHAGSLALLINLGALIAVGLVLERVVGRPALVAVYLSAGVLAL
jgi:membrane associated rhomboid family serine protease